MQSGVHLALLLGWSDQQPAWSQGRAGGGGESDYCVRSYYAGGWGETVLLGERLGGGA